MTRRCRSSVAIVGSSLLLAVAACGNNGAPPYAPDTPRAAAGATVSAGAAAVAPASAARAVAGTAPADPHALYDLKAKCGADARQWYQHFYEDSGVLPRQSTLSHGFTSHYNVRTNDCFALTRSISRIEDLKSRRPHRVEAHAVADVLENKTVGTFLGEADAAVAAECHVAGNVCKSRAEWDSLTAPYMND